MTNKTKNRLFYFLAIIPYVSLDYVSYVFPAWLKITLAARLLLLVSLGVHMVAIRKKITIPFALGMVYFTGCFISTFWAEGNFHAIIGGGILLFGMTLLIEDGIFTDVDAMIDGMLIWFEILIYGNLLFYILNPSGYLDTGAWAHYYLLGHHNTVIRKVFLGIVLGAIQAFRTKNRITLRFACMFLALAIFLLRARAMTAVMGMAVFASAILYHTFTRRSGIFKYEYFVVLTGWISIQFAVLQRFSFAQDFITKILGKNMALSGRTFLWEETVNKICESPFLGFGQLRVTVAQEIIGGIDPHNILLGTLFCGGILGFIILIFLLSVYGRKIYRDRKQNRSLLFIFEAGLCACFTMACFEPFTPLYEFHVIYVLLVMAYHNGKFEKAITSGKNFRLSRYRQKKLGRREIRERKIKFQRAKCFQEFFIPAP